MSLKRIALLTVGAIVTIIGAVLTISPIPFGIFIVVPGLALMVMASDDFARWVKHRRERHGKFHRTLRKASGKAPDDLHNPLRKTDPDDDDCIDEKPVHGR